MSETFTGSPTLRTTTTRPSDDTVQTLFERLEAIDKHSREQAGFRDRRVEELLSSQPVRGSDYEARWDEKFAASEARSADLRAKVSALEASYHGELKTIKERLFEIETHSKGVETRLSARVDTFSASLQDAKAVRSKVVHVTELVLRVYDMRFGTFPPRVLGGSRFRIAPHGDVPRPDVETKLELTEGRAEAKRRALWIQAGGAQFNAVLLSQNEVLTAGHCVRNALRDNTLNITAIVRAEGEVHVRPPPLLSVGLDTLYADDPTTGLDVAVLTFSTPLVSDGEHVLPPLCCCGPFPSQAVVSHTVFSEGEIFLQSSTRLELNHFSSSHSYYQGPARRGHSGAGVYTCDGFLVGLMSESVGPCVNELAE